MGNKVRSWLGDVTHVTDSYTILDNGDMLITSEQAHNLHAWGQEWKARIDKDLDWYLQQMPHRSVEEALLLDQFRLGLWAPLQKASVLQLSTIVIPISELMFYAGAVAGARSTKEEEPCNPNNPGMKIRNKMLESCVKSPDTHTSDWREYVTLMQRTRESKRSQSLLFGGVAMLLLVLGITLGAWMANLGA
jgi:hypothetical protein